MPLRRELDGAGGSVSVEITTAGAARARGASNKLLCLGAARRRAVSSYARVSPRGPAGRTRPGRGKPILDILYKCRPDPEANPFRRTLFGKGPSDRARAPNLRIFKVKFIWSGRRVGGVGAAAGVRWGHGTKRVEGAYGAPGRVSSSPAAASGKCESGHTNPGCPGFVLSPGVLPVIIYRLYHFENFIFPALGRLRFESVSEGFVRLYFLPTNSELGYQAPLPGGHGDRGAVASYRVVGLEQGAAGRGSGADAAPSHIRNHGIIGEKRAEGKKSEKNCSQPPFSFRKRRLRRGEPNIRPFELREGGVRSDQAAACGGRRGELHKRQVDLENESCYTIELGKVLSYPVRSRRRAPRRALRAAPINEITFHRYTKGTKRIRRRFKSPPDLTTKHQNTPRKEVQRDVRRTNECVIAPASVPRFSIPSPPVALVATRQYQNNSCVTIIKRFRLLVPPRPPNLVLRKGGSEKAKRGARNPAALALMAR
ncbi:hypothetical protein EVAR_67245_1 [Eumeta japonica]|uniref:Uncharacterized protein n=1 Tax=Eumeta variegata TaxID=151549 RepID=A0A4C1YPW4_EUMVA|nr:hypothetical protein EVAR_67245_1 [Eumeta japonica]